MAELIFNVILFVFFLAMLIYSGQIAIWDGHIWARYWPMALLVAAVILFGIKVVRVYRALPKEKRKFDPAIFGLGELNVKKLLVAFVWVFVYAAILPYLGFLIATFIFCCGTQLLLGAKITWKIPVVSFVIMAAIYAIFVWGLGVSVPRGVGPLYNFGRWLEYLWS